ncbi:MAG: hypothetical protein ACHP84_18495 [Caulobacterales bacterium]
MAIAGPLCAQTLAEPHAPLMPAKGAAVHPAIDLSKLRTSLSVRYALSSPVRDAGPNRTQIDHRFARDGLVGSAGYMCGIDGVVPDTNLTGGGPASTFGRQGTFLGARLGYSFK